MPQSIRDIKLTVRDLLRDNIDQTAFPEPLADDAIHTGWWDAGKGNPQISVSRDEESPFDGGRTGYAGFAGDGSGPIQHRAGTVQVDCWAGTRDDYEEVGLEQTQREAMADEVERIILQNATALSELDSLSVVSSTTIADTDAEPTEHRVRLIVQFTYTKTPS